MKLVFSSSDALEAVRRSAIAVNERPLISQLNWTFLTGIATSCPLSRRASSYLVIRWLRVPAASRISEDEQAFVRGFSVISLGGIGLP